MGEGSFNWWSTVPFSLASTKEFTRVIRQSAKIASHPQTNAKYQIIYACYVILG